MFCKRRYVLLILITAVVASYLTYSFTMLRYQNLFEAEREEIVYLEDFFRVYRYAKEEFVDEVDSGKMMEGAISGLLDALNDPYTAYLTEEQYERILQQSAGSFGGVGLYVGIREEKITIIAPIEGTPGAESGLMRGDEIVAVDGVDVTGMVLDEVVDMMRGEVGEIVEVTIKREGETSLRVYSIRRAIISIETVTSAVLENQVGYLSISEFNKNTKNDVLQALNELKKEDMQGLVLDLRNNPGGILTESIEIAGHLVPPGEIVQIVSRHEMVETKSSRTKGIEVPLVVLINEGSASASEIIAGAVKDREAGVLVGSTSFGKASVQGIFGLSYGGGFKMTTDRYLTPKGTLIQGQGIDPHYHVYDLGDRSYAVGDFGEDIKQLQAMLFDMDYYKGFVHGDYDEKTRDALYDFLIQEEIEYDEQVGTRFHALLIANNYRERFPEKEMEDLVLKKGIELLSR